MYTTTEPLFISLSTIRAQDSGVFFHSHDLPLKIDLREAVSTELIIQNILVQTQILGIMKLLYGKIIVHLADQL